MPRVEKNMPWWELRGTHVQTIMHLIESPIARDTRKSINFPEDSVERQIMLSGLENNLKLEHERLHQENPNSHKLKLTFEELDNALICYTCTQGFRNEKQMLFVRDILLRPMVNILLDKSSISDNQSIDDVIEMMRPRIDTMLDVYQ